MLDRLENELKTRGFSQKTIESYLLYNQQFLNFTKKEPEKIEEQDIKNYLTYLTNNNNYKPRSINLALSSLKFAFSHILNKKITDNIKLQKLDKKNSIILTKEEIKALINATENPKHKLLFKLMVSSGLRVGEAISLKISDVNLDEKLLTVKYGKNNKKRTTFLSEDSINDLKKYLAKRNDDNPYLFSVKDRHISIKLPQKIIKLSAKKANLHKRIFCHVLRSTFAHLLLNNGIHSKYVQFMLGSSPHINNEFSKKLFREEIKKIKNPFDNIFSRDDVK